MIIREAQHRDIPRMEELGQILWAETPHYKCFNYNPIKVRAYIEWMLNHRETAIAIVGEDNGVVQGGFLGFVQEHFFGSDKQAYDSITFVDPEYRGTLLGYRLMKRYVEEAKARGAKQILLGNTTGINYKSVMGIYKKMGFSQVGGNFVMYNGG